MSIHAMTTQPRRGISLLEVLMTIFIIATGLASVFALFVAGREIELRSIRQSEAAAVAQAVGEPLADQWCDTFQWQWDVGAGLTWAGPISLPVLVDPWGLSSDAIFFVPIPDEGKWDMRQFIPAANDFLRVTVPSTPRTSQSDSVVDYSPRSREESLSSFADPDAIEFQTPTDEANPPQPWFEGGRRKRGTDFVPALFLCNTDNAVGPPINPVARWLLIFYKPAAHLDGGFMGVHELVPDPSAGSSEPDLLKLKPFNSSTDEIDLQRAFQPSKWILVTLGSDAPFVRSIDHAYWKQIISATRDENGTWLIALDAAIDGISQTKVVRAYGFESLIHVKKLSDAALTGF